ncbi:MAG: L-fucose isomerase [Clostridiales bacterium]|nr:L-fucose isomerase [Clostridiales bacterium]
MYPKIGIRPIIDGRRGGVRESLEEKTMGMARAAARLIEGALRYGDGRPAQCVIAPTCIGGCAEAAAAAELFSRENVTATLSVTPCWCYGSETMDMDPLTLKAVWGFNGTERPGAVYLAAAMSAHAQRGLPAFAIYGREVQSADCDDIPADVAEKILRFARCALAAGQMKGKSYVNIGGVAMGIMGSYCDAQMLQEYFGMRAEWVDMTELLRRIHLGIYDPAEYEKALAWTKSNCREGFDKNPADKRHSREQKDAEWAFVVKMTLCCRDMILGNPRLAEMGYGEEALGHNGIAGGFQGQRAWTDWLPNGDFTEAILNSSFDWNGVRRPLALATENDGLNGICLLLGQLLTGGASVFADVRTYWSPESVERAAGWRPEGRAAAGLIHLINSGAAALDATGRQKDPSGAPVMKPWWEVSEADAAACLEATQWCPADLGYFRGGGYSSRFSTAAELPVTLIRLNLAEGMGPVLQLAEGYTLQLPAEVEKTLWERTDATWPTTWFAPRLSDGPFADVYSVMSNWGANHGVFAYGHIGRDLITLASMLRIPVSLHNIPEEQLMRPHCFGAFGTKDPEGADFAACRQYGPLYGTCRGRG